MFKHPAALLDGMPPKGVIDEPLQNGPEILDQSGLVFFGDVTSVQMVSVFFNVQGHVKPKCRREKPAAHINANGGFTSIAACFRETGGR